MTWKCGIQKGLMAAAFAATAVAGQKASALDWAYLSDTQPGNTNPVTALTNAGATPVQIGAGLAAFDFSTVDGLFLETPSDNSYTAYSAELLAKMGDIGTAVQNGMNLVIFDAMLAHPTTLGPHALLSSLGAAGTMVIQETGLPQSLVTDVDESSNANTGLTDASLDSANPANRSSHGYATEASLPLGSTVHQFRQLDNSQVVGFDYPYGDGHVFFSTIPAEFYLTNDVDIAGALRDTLIPNVIARLEGCSQDPFGCPGTAGPGPGTAGPGPGPGQAGPGPGQAGPGPGQVGPGPGGGNPGNAVPEPITGALGLIGLGVLSLNLRRRHAS